MFEDILKVDSARFTTQADAKTAIEQACGQHPDLARFERIGASEAGRPLHAAVIGRGERRVSLVGGAHADEPVGPQTLRHLCVGLLAHRDRLADVLDRFTFIIVPHVNPDGEAMNRPWMQAWPDPLAYFQQAVREPPGRDVEFGYPEMRPENRAVADLLRREGPMNLHMSLHGMAVADGAWLLIDRHWVDRTADLRQRWLEAIDAAGLKPFDWDRAGDKGFEYVGPGFSTTPRGEAMRAHFHDAGDPETAKLFHDSSMEYVRSLGGDPLTLVTELPLFVLRGQVATNDPGVPGTFLAFKENLPRWRAMLEAGREAEVMEEARPFDLQPLPLETAMNLQLRAIALGVETAGQPQ